MRVKRSSTIFWKPETAYALGPYKTLTRGLGIWPMDGNSMTSTIRLSLVIVTQLLMSISLIHQLLIKGNCGAITDIVDVLSLIICGFLTAMKVIILRVYQKNMQIIVTSAIKDWTIVRDDRHTKIMLQYAYSGRVVFIMQMMGAYAAGFPLIFSRLPFIVALWNDHDNATIRSVPIGPSCWVLPEMDPYQYHAYFLFQSIQLFVVCTGYIGADTYFFGIAMHVCGQYELLYDQLQCFYGSTGRSRQKAKLCNFINRHKHLLSLANHFEQTFNLIILAQVAADTLLTSVSGLVLLIALPSGDLIIIGGLVIRIYLVYIQLFMYSYVGEKLNNEVDNVQISLYNTPWYNMRSCVVRDMIFIMMRGNYEFCLTAGKMYNMNMRNYKNIVKAMGSYFSVMRVKFMDNVNS